MSEETSPVSVSTAVLLTAATMLVAVVLPALLYAFIKQRRKQTMHEHLIQRQLQDAINTTRRLDCPAIYIRADTFCQLGRLRKHEELRDSGDLVYKDKLKDLTSHDEFIVFLSHQWTSGAHPDPDCVQYPVMVAAVQRLAQSIVDGDFLGSRFLKHGTHGALCGNSFSAKQSAGTGTGATDGAVKMSDEDEENDRRIRRVLQKLLIWVDYISIPRPCFPAFKHLRAPIRPSFHLSRHPHSPRPCVPLQLTLMLPLSAWYACCSQRQHPRCRILLYIHYQRIAQLPRHSSLLHQSPRTWNPERLATSHPIRRECGLEPSSSATQQSRESTPCGLRPAKVQSIRWAHTSYCPWVTAG